MPPDYRSKKPRSKGRELIGRGGRGKGEKKGGERDGYQWSAPTLLSHLSCCGPERRRIRKGKEGPLTATLITSLLNSSSIAECGGGGGEKKGKKGKKRGGRRGGKVFSSLLFPSSHLFELYVV